MSRIQYKNPPIAEAVADKMIDNLLSTVDYNDNQKERIIEFLRGKTGLVDIVQEGMTEISHLTGSNSFFLWLSTDTEEGTVFLEVMNRANFDIAKSLEIEEVLFKNWYRFLPIDIKRSVIFGVD